MQTGEQASLLSESFEPNVAYAGEEFGKSFSLNKFFCSKDFLRQECSAAPTFDSFLAHCGALPSRSTYPWRAFVFADEFTAWRHAPCVLLLK